MDDRASPRRDRARDLRSLVRDNGLTLALLAAFALALVGQVFAGWSLEREDALQHGALAPGLGDYLGSAEFLSAVFENWESEFLQMSSYIVLTAMLFQRGSPESRDPDDPDAELREPGGRGAEVPWPVRAGGWVAAVYARSLGLALFLLFALSWAAHLWASHGAAVAAARRHGASPPGFAEHAISARFWFESFQNWQSEFLSVAVLVVLSIFLRQVGSPESKPVSAPHSRSGR